MAYNILHIDTERTWRGGEAQAFSLCKGLLSSEFHPFAIAQPKSPFSQRLKEIGVKCFDLTMRGEFDLKAAWKISNLCRKKKIDLIHAHDAHAHALAWFVSKRLKKIPVVVTRRVDFPVGGNFFSRMKYKSKSMNFIAISSGVKDVLVKGGVSEDKIDIVFSGIDPERFDNHGDGSEFRKKFNVKDGEIIIGNVAALSDHKGQIYLIDAAAQVIEKFPGARFFIIGEGELRDELLSRIRERGLDGKITLTGFLNDIGDALAAMDLFVLSSHLEGLCTSLLDAAIMQVPIVATRTGGVPDIVEDGVTGYLAEARNSDSLASAILKILDDPECMETFKNTAYEKVLKYFTTDKMVEGTMKVYKKILT
jgi:L-malate glycosyltransferase